MPKDTGNEIKLPSLDELFSSQQERDEAKLKHIYEIPIDQIDPFPDHPFKVKADLQMLQLIESISKYGILNPLIVRPLPEGVYEIIAGHRRKYAAQHLGFRKMPVIIRVLRDDDAVINMVDSNLFRESIRPSEKAFAYKMKYEAIKRKSGRKNGGQIDYHLLGRRTIDIIGEDSGESAKQVQRFMKLTELIPELQEMLDEGAIAFNPAYEIAFLTEEEQKNLIKAMDYTFTEENTMDILLQETGRVFSEVLEDAGVYKNTEEGRRGFLRFVDEVNKEA